MKTINKIGMIKFKSNFIICLLLFLGCITTACKKESVFLERPKPELIIKRDNPRLKSKTIHFVKDTVYVLQVSMVIDSGQILKIDAGSLIKVNINHSIIVKPGGKIEAEGNQQEPIIFTVKVDKGGGLAETGSGSTKTSWKGIWMYGSAISLNSGKLRYVRIEFAGTQNSPENASLYLNNIGSQTSLDHIQVSYSHQPAFIFNGGSVNASNLVAYATYQSDFVLSNGYKGKLQNVLAFKNPLHFFGNLNAGLLLQNAETFPIISNVTVIGPSNQKGPVVAIGGRNAAIIVQDSAKFHIRNSAVLGFPVGGLQIDGEVSGISLENEESSIMHSIFHSINASTAFTLTRYPTRTSSDLKSFLLSGKFDNRQYNHIREFMLNSPFDYYSTNTPDPSPSSDSPLLNGARFEDVLDDPFFKKVNYRGALGAGADNWLQGWTNFLPLQTNYNF